MGLITLFLITAFSLFYFSRTPGEKPAFVLKTADFVTTHLAVLAPIAIVYGFFAAFMSLLTIGNGLDIIARVLANALIIAMALPLGIDALLAKLSGKAIDAARAERWRERVMTLAGFERELAYFGFASAFFLFAVIFR